MSSSLPLYMVSSPLSTFFTLRDEPKLIGAGSTVELMLASGTSRVFILSADSQNTAPAEGIISLESPLGRALWGKTAGQNVEYAVGERVLSVKVVAVR